MFNKLKNLFSNKNTNNADCYKPYLSPEEIVNDLLTSLPKRDLNVIKHTVQKDLIFFHMNLGRDIRNNYKLWDEDNPYTSPKQKTHAEYQPIHPDELSFTIIGMLWERLQ
jgi:hypothetical protein